MQSLWPVIEQSISALSRYRALSDDETDVLQHAIMMARRAPRAPKLAWTSEHDAHVMAGGCNAHLAAETGHSHRAVITRRYRLRQG